MIEGIQPKPLYEVGPIFAGYLGLDWCRDRSKVVTLLNEFRDLLHIDPDFPNMFTHKSFCINPSCFPISCRNTCSCGEDTFKGFTLPRELENIEQAWVDDDPIDLHSKWWEGRCGIVGNGTPIDSYKIVATGEVSPTQRMLRRPSVLKFYSEGNHKKEVIVWAHDIDGDLTSYKVKIRKGEVVELQEYINHIDSVSIPKLDGCEIKMYDDEDYLLSSYDGSQRTPQYPVYKVLAPCKNNIRIHGKQKFRELYFDDQIVEIGSLTILKAAAKMMRYDDEGTDVNEMNISDRNKRKLVRLIKGAIKRRRGGNVQDGSILTGLTASMDLPKLNNY